MPEITKQMIAALREKTGAGPVDCKNALIKANGSEEEAITILQKKGMASASKKTSRIAQEGCIHSYIHNGNRLGVLVEVNCETDFVANTEDFKTFVADISLQIAATNPPYIKKEEVPTEILQKQKEIVLAQCEGKPASAIEKIVEGRLHKWYSENCLLEQPFVKNDATTIGKMLKELISKIGENIVVKRFVCFQLGETGSNKIEQTR